MQRFKHLHFLIYFIWGLTATAQSDVAVPLYEDFASFQKVVLHDETNQVKLINFWATCVSHVSRSCPIFNNSMRNIPSFQWYW